MILSGDACVSIYSKEKYVSIDLDMIHTSLFKPKRKLIRDAMAEMGFVKMDVTSNILTQTYLLNSPRGRLQLERRL